MSVSAQVWKQLQDDGEWYIKHREELLDRYPGEFVAISKAAVVAHRASMGSLVTDLRASSLDPGMLVVEYVPRADESLQMIRSFR